MLSHILRIAITVFALSFYCLGPVHQTEAASRTQARYFAHEAREDTHGVIAPWYTGLNGQCDLRVRVAAETLKRYPWMPGKDGKLQPDYIYNGRWSIASDGTITPGELKDWGNGDLVQRGTYSIFGLVSYYRYSGDPAAIAHVAMIADAMLDRCRTGPDHEWPGFIISVPNFGEPYGQCSDKGMIQLDLAAMAGDGLIQAYKLTGNERYLDAARHWARLFAAKRNRTPGQPPWNRYANPQETFWNDLQTGGVVLIARLFDELIRVEQANIGARSASEGESRRGDAATRRRSEQHRSDESAVANAAERTLIAELTEARDAGLAYVRDVLLPAWYVDDTWGRDYWDWEHPVQSESLSEMVPRYFMRNQQEFPNWRNDCRNILSLYLSRASVSPLSDGDVYHGAWSFPEGSQCCERSLSYPPMQIGAAIAEYAELTGDEWARELARRQLILSTYDFHQTGVVEDNMDGGEVVAGGWFQISHPLPLAYVLDAMGWLPDVLGANRENHIMRSSSLVTRVTYAPGQVSYRTFDAPAKTVDVLRLAFVPNRVLAGGQDLPRGDVDAGNAYSVRPLDNGDCIVTVRHDGRLEVAVHGDDPQQRMAAPLSGSELEFEGNQVRLIGTVGPDGGSADVYIDGIKQLCGIDFWNPLELGEQVVYYRNGLSDGKHTIRVVDRGQGNPLSQGKAVRIDAVDVSAATGSASTGQGGGPTGVQRWVFGYTRREDYVDAQGNAWRPGTEVVIRLGHVVDAVSAWYTQARRQTVAGTDDPTLYSHGIHGQDFTAHATVGPGQYYVRLKFMESRWNVEPAKRCVDIYINGKQVVDDMDIAATAAGRAAVVRFVSPNATRIYEGLNQAVDLVFNNVEPKHGVISVRLTGNNGGEAILSAIQIGPGHGGEGARPISAEARAEVEAQ